MTKTKNKKTTKTVNVYDSESERAAGVECLWTHSSEATTSGADLEFEPRCSRAEGVFAETDC